MESLARYIYEVTLIAPCIQKEFIWWQ